MLVTPIKLSILWWPTTLGETSSLVTAVGVCECDTPQELQPAEPRGKATAARLSDSVERPACMKDNVSRAKGSNGRLPVKLEGDHPRLGRTSSRLRHAQARLGHPQFMGKLLCLGRPMRATAPTAALDGRTIKVIHASMVYIVREA